MTQLSFSDVEFGAKRKQTRREKFLAEMNTVFLGPGWWRWLNRFIPKAKVVVRRMRLRPCFGFILCSNGLH